MFYNALEHSMHTHLLQESDPPGNNLKFRALRLKVSEVVTSSETLTSTFPQN